MNIRLILCLIVFAGLSAFKVKPVKRSPLAVYATEWSLPAYSKANTAVDADYMTVKEKEVIEILNLVRLDPQLFANTVLKKYPQTSGNARLANTHYYRSLMNELLKMKPLNVLQPDEQAFISAKAHAYASGISGYVGHDRKGDALKKRYYNGECCYYGKNDPIDIVISLLIDEGVPSLGHRKIMLSNYNTVGVSIQPHSIYRTNTVMDFHF